MPARGPQKPKQHNEVVISLLANFRFGHFDATKTFPSLVRLYLMKLSDAEWEAELQRINTGGSIQTVDPHRLIRIWRVREGILPPGFADPEGNRDAALEIALSETAEEARSASEYFAVILRAMVSRIAMKEPRLKTIIEQQNSEQVLSVISTMPLSGSDLTDRDSFVERLQQLLSPSTS